MNSNKLTLENILKAIVQYNKKNNVENFNIIENYGDEEKAILDTISSIKTTCLIVIIIFLVSLLITFGGQSYWFYTFFKANPDMSFGESLIGMLWRTSIFDILIIIIMYITIKIALNSIITDIMTTAVMLI